ncbi:GFA family protein [Vibrio sp. RC27]
MSNTYKGSCLCGVVTFTVESFDERVAHCHCSMCRKFHGAAYATLVGSSGLTWLSGCDYLKEFVAPNGTIRTFCSECGSSIGFRTKGVPLSHIELAIATFDEPIPTQPDAHIYTQYKANWCELHDTLPKFKEGRDGPRT